MVYLPTILIMKPIFIAVASLAYSALRCKTQKRVAAHSAATLFWVLQVPYTPSRNLSNIERSSNVEVSLVIS